MQVMIVDKKIITCIRNIFTNARGERLYDHPAWTGWSYNLEQPPAILRLQRSSTSVCVLHWPFKS